jgi:hypothetical protein
MRVKCINNFNSFDNLTIGKEYEVLKEEPIFYTIRNDEGTEMPYKTTRFVEVIKMNKSNIKSGMVVETREGKRMIAFIGGEKECVVEHGGGYISLDDFKDDLTCSPKEFDIVKIYKPKSNYSISTFISSVSIYGYELVWERKDNSKEVEALKAEIKKVENCLNNMKTQLNTLERER